MAAKPRRKVVHGVLELREAVRATDQARMKHLAVRSDPCADGLAPWGPALFAWERSLAELADQLLAVGDLLEIFDPALSVELRDYVTAPNDGIAAIRLNGVDPERLVMYRIHDRERYGNHAAVEMAVISVQLDGWGDAENRHLLRAEEASGDRFFNGVQLSRELEHDADELLDMLDGFIREHFTLEEVHGHVSRVRS